MEEKNFIKVGVAQITPVWLNKWETINKIENYIFKAGEEKCDLVTFGEAILPGYPFWISLTNGAEFNSSVQKELYSHYVKNSVEIENGDLNSICNLAKEKKIVIYLGIIERADNRGGHSLYCSLVFINSNGEIQSVHRKLQPTYEERLTWAHGDGHGLRTHKLKNFTVGGLNCWENWMPLSRAAFYGMGENLHIAVWPGSKRNTEDITRFIAKEGRSFVISVSGLMKKRDFPKDTPHLDLILECCPDILTDGGSCIAAPNGEWILEPRVGKEELFIRRLDLNKVFEERQNFDPAGHYSRPDVTQLIVNRKRQSIIDLTDD